MIICLNFLYDSFSPATPPFKSYTSYTNLQISRHSAALCMSDCVPVIKLLPLVIILGGDFVIEHIVLKSF